VLLFKCRWLSQINMRYKSDRRAQWKTFEDIWRFSLLLQLQSSTIRYFNLFLLNSFVAIWPFGGLSSFDLPSRTFWESHHILHLGIFWKTWCPCPPDLSTGCRSECQQRSTAKVKVDEGNGRKKSSENGSNGGWPFCFDGQFGTPKSITCSTVSILSYLLFGTIGNWWILGIALKHSS